MSLPWASLLLSIQRCAHRKLCSYSHLTTRLPILLHSLQLLPNEGSCHRINLGPHSTNWRDVVWGDSKHCTLELSPTSCFLSLWPPVLSCLPLANAVFTGVSLMLPFSSIVSQWEVVPKWSHCTWAPVANVTLLFLGISTAISLQNLENLKLEP